MSDHQPPRVTLEIEGQIAFVTLNRPEKHNGFDSDMMRALVDTAGKLRRNRAVRCVVLHGAGKSFSAGLDFSTVSRRHPVALALDFFTFGLRRANLFQQTCRAWRTLPIPVIAVTHGHCYGAGFQLALAADFRLTTADCEFSIMEAKWGLIPDMTASLTLRELAPGDISRRLTMTGETFNASQAQKWNLVTEICSNPLAEARKLAAQLASRSPDALAAAKALFNDTWTANERRALATERGLQFRLLLGENLQRAIKARFKGLEPDYKDRMRW